MSKTHVSVLIRFNGNASCYYQRGRQNLRDGKHLSHMHLPLCECHQTSKWSGQSVLISAYCVLFLIISCVCRLDEWPYLYLPLRKHC